MIRDKKNIGLSPYSMHFTGERKVDKMSLNVIDYNYNDVNEIDINSINDLLQFKNTDNVSWCNVVGLHDEEIMTDISDFLDIPPYIMSYVMNPLQRPKIQEFENGLFISLKILEIVDNEIQEENLSIIFIGKLLITFKEKKNNIFIPILNRIINERNKIKKLGIDYLAFSLINIVIEHYNYIISTTDDKLEYLEDDIMNDNFKKGFSKHILPNITKYKSYLNLISKYLKTFKDNFNEIKKTDLISDENKIFYHELEHDIIDLYDTTENLKEKLNEQFNMYHTITSSKLNDIMKTLTIVSVLFNPLTFIAGVYGTNFKYFPEIYWKYGYFFMWGMIIICGLCMLLYFKKKKWF